MIRLPFYRKFLCESSVKILPRVLCSKSVYTYKRQYAVENPGTHKEKIINYTKYHACESVSPSSKYQNDNNSAIKIPRFLRKTKDKEQIDRYYRVKKLCFEGNFNSAISNVEKWLSGEAVTTSTILILNGLLYSLFEHGKMKDIVSLKETMDSYDIKGDRSTYTVLIDSFGKMKNFGMVSKLLEDMSHLNMDPHYRSYMVATELALNEKNFAKAHEYFLQIESVYKENHDEFCALFISSLVKNKEVSIVEGVFQEFRENKIRLGEQMMMSIETYFHSGLFKDKWKTSRTTLSTSGICECCKEKLEEAEFGKPEENLSVYFQKLVNNELNTDTSGFRLQETRKDKLQELFRLLESEGPFQVVIDGLNVAMHPRRGLDFDPLFKLVESYSSQGQKVLIVAANELIHPKRSKAVTTADHQKAMAYLRSISTVYFVKHNKSGIDDLFLINAALHLCREDNKVKMISNDKFMDHRVNMKPQTLSYFKRWLSDHQVMVHWYDRTRMKLLPETKTVFARVVQKTENSWHFPSIDEKPWMCVKRI